MNTPNNLNNIALVGFDLDDTVTLSKSPLDKEMAELLCQLLQKKKVVIVSGASFDQFQTQLLDHLHCSEECLANLYILSESGASLYLYKDRKWSSLYHELLTDEEKEKIFQAFEKTFHEINFKKAEKIYGTQIEDRHSQITFSGLGSEAPLDLKRSWDPDHLKREEIMKKLSLYLADFNVRAGGTTSIDITKAGIDKAYGLDYLMKYLKLNRDKIIYVGDALYQGGNDTAVFKLSIQTREVSGVDETKIFIKSLL